MPNKQTTNSYVLCINDGGYPESLEIRKIYVVLPDERAAARNYIRVIDETGEDYLYPAKHFVPIQVPPEAISVMPAGTTTRNLRTRD